MVFKSRLVLKGAGNSRRSESPCFSRGLAGWRYTMPFWSLDYCIFSAATILAALFPCRIIFTTHLQVHGPPFKFLCILHFQDLLQTFTDPQTFSTCLTNPISNVGTLYFFLPFFLKSPFYLLFCGRLLITCPSFSDYCYL